MDVIQRFGTNEKLSFYKDGSTDKVNFKVNFAKGLGPDLEKIQDVCHLFRGILVCVQTDISKKNRKDIKKSLRELIREL